MSSQNSKKNEGKEVFRPYARIISILGDQLITSKWVGVIELVKNCYDADASTVSVRFSNFTTEQNSSIAKNEAPNLPSIEIEDDGHGMTLDVIRDVWMKPATPYKLNQKKSKQTRHTEKGRLMQGDKGVGRFAIYKLGNHVEIFTKTDNTPEVKLTLNFHEYAQNDEFSSEEAPQLFLDEITNEWKVNEVPTEIKDRGRGTIIRITDLRSGWHNGDLDRLENAFRRMIPPIIPQFKGKISRDFDVNLYWNDTKFPTSGMSFEEIIKLAPFYLEGSIDQKGTLTYIYRHNEQQVIEEIDFFDAGQVKTHDVWNLKLFKDQFLAKTEEEKARPIKVVRQRSNSTEHVPKRMKWTVRRKPSIGNFSFFFYAFDWNNRLELDSSQEAFIKDNSVYLYRDLTRVYPYGEKGVDWLMLSKLRAEDRAARYFSYNDLIGFVFISQENNPKLRDAADREGLMNVDGAYDDFVALIQAALKVMKDHVDVDKYKTQLRRERSFTLASRKFDLAFNRLRDDLARRDDKEALIKAQNLLKATHELVRQYQDKLTIVQELAGVGMAVEKSSHDIFVVLRTMIQSADDILTRFKRGKLASQTLEQFLADIRENLEVLYQEVQILQPLFRVARKSTAQVSIKEAAQRVERFYQKELKYNINFKIEGGEDIIVSANLGLVLQVLINLVDNAIYWLGQKKVGPRQITVKIDSTANRLIVADNGPGIGDDSIEIIFSEFFSTKADGRGLGLYIARELLERIGANISVISTGPLKILPGANFLIQFAKG